ncbi:MAG TPA: hypothetical protein EYQ64_00850 [Gemmatimonadetes bacterium]|nr:hypothetical protein [Gemmatimonadota bacterium]
MTRFYMQREPGARDTLAALALAIGVGGVSYYLVRMLLAREALESQPPPALERGPRPGKDVRSEGAG